MPREQGGIGVGSAFESTSSIPLHANGYFLTQADLLAPQYRHPTWLLYVAETKARLFIRPLAECVMGDGSPATGGSNGTWGTLLAHYEPAGATLTVQALLGLLEAGPGITISLNQAGTKVLISATGGGSVTPAPAPSDLAVNSVREASWTPAAGTTAADYEQQFIPNTDPLPAPTDLAVTSQRVASYTPDAGTSSTDYEFQVL